MAMRRSPGLGDRVPSPRHQIAAGKSPSRRHIYSTLFCRRAASCYVIIRKRVFSVVETDQAVVSLFEQLRIPPGPAIENSTLSALTVRDIASTFTASHFEVRGSTSLGSAHKGTRPGHPYADVVFSFAFHQVFKALAIDLNTDDLKPKVPTAFFINGELQQGEDVRLPIPGSLTILFWW